VPSYDPDWLGRRLGYDRRLGTVGLATPIVV
jgi:hypothetical protein